MSWRVIKMFMPLTVIGPQTPAFSEILTVEALAFVEALVQPLMPEIHAARTRRTERQRHFDGGGHPDFLPETQSVRDGDWRINPVPAVLHDRRVEITGPVDRKMVINALNSGANCFMADFEDSNAPSWSNLIEGQLNLRDAVRGTISFRDERRNKDYALNDTTATLLVRPRGFHLDEAHVLLDDRAIPGGLFDFGLYVFHNAKALIDKGAGPFFYLPKMESHLEARIWNRAFEIAQDNLSIPRGTIKATVLIETLPAAFEMDEILYELREHSAGLNCGRWDYIFSYIKTFREHADKVLPDRSAVGMTQPFMDAYSKLLIQTCHRRGAHAMGGMAAQIPIKNDPAANDAALEKVRQDKLREAQNGHDGTWVAHPALVAIAKSVFDAEMPTASQFDVSPTETITAEMLCAAPTGPRTEAGLRQNINVGLLYLEAWLRGSGCVPLYNLMEDAATAEISRTQLWQWIRHKAPLDDGRAVTRDLVESVLQDELQTIERDLGAEQFAAGQFAEATRIFREVATAERCADFLTLPAYAVLTRGTAA